MPNPWEPPAPLYLQLDLRNLDRFEKARVRAGWPRYRWFRSQGLTAFTSAPLGKMWSDIKLEPDSLEGVLDAVLLGLELEVPKLTDDLRTFRDRPTDGSREWSKVAYVDEHYRADVDGESTDTKAVAKPIVIDATLEQVIARARDLGITPHEGYRPIRRWREHGAFAPGKRTVCAAWGERGRTPRDGAKGCAARLGGATWATASRRPPTEPTRGVSIHPQLSGAVN